MDFKGIPGASGAPYTHIVGPYYWLAGPAPIIVVENLEERLTRWALSEYVEAFELAWERGIPLIVSGLLDPLKESLLKSKGLLVSREASRAFNRPCSILLDLRAERSLSCDEARNACALIVGGIMGDHPPRGRTALLYDKYTYAARRNLGRLQLSVEGAVRVLAWMISEGRKLEDLEFKWPVRVSVRIMGREAEVELPFAYPVSGGRVLVPGRIIELLKSGIIWDEELL